MTQVEQLRWTPPEDGLPIVAMTRERLFADHGGPHLQAHERLDFNLVILCTGGTGTHSVDYATAEIRPGRALHVVPGQVHRWAASPTYEATLLLFPDAPLQPVRWPVGPTTVDLDAEQLDRVRTTIGLIDETTNLREHPPGRLVALRALRDLVFVQLRLGIGPTTAVANLHPAYVAFRDDLETNLTAAESLSARAARLGYSTRTINRACVEVAGRTAKQVRDDRLVLQAKRLLAQPTTTTTAIAAGLGFSEVTNFSRFFKRLTGSTPARWRDERVHI